MFIGLLVCELLLAPMPSIYALYSPLIGMLGLSVEATLPIPQILANAQSKSSKGFRLSVLASWLLGDAFKIFWFFTATTEIPLTFKVCGIFQASCDVILGLQYYIYGEGPQEVKEHLMDEVAAWKQPQSNESPAKYQVTVARAHSRSLTPTRRPAPFHDLKGVD
jgi:solute carrier family 66, member 2